MAKKVEQKYEIKDPSAPMTKGQSYALYSMTGVDVRELDLTKGQASDLIDKANNGNCKAVRLALIKAGGEVKTRDVHKNHRGEKNPTGYKPAPAAKKATPKKAKKVEVEDDDDDDQIGLTIEALQKLATDDPAQLIALFSGKPLSKPEPKQKAKTQKKTATKKPAAAKKDDSQNVSDDVAEELAKLLAG